MALTTTKNDVATQGGPAMRAFKNNADRWKLTQEERLAVLGGMPPSTYFKWLKEPRPRVTPDTLERISYVLGIFKALHILLPDSDADRWIHRPNRAPLFGGKSAKDKLLSGRML